MIDDFDGVEAPIFDMKKWREKTRAAVDTGKKGWRARSKNVDASVDKRSLRETGRTAQFNFKSTPGLHQRAKEAAARKGVRLAEWMEGLVEAALAAEDKGRDA